MQHETHQDHPSAEAPAETQQAEDRQGASGPGRTPWRGSQGDPRRPPLLASEMDIRMAGKLSGIDKITGRSGDMLTGKNTLSLAR